MAIDVKIIEWEPGFDLPLHELDGEMFDVPAVGSPYWRRNVAMRVREIEETEPVRVHLERDLQRERELLTGLPADCTVDGGRDSNTGRGHAVVERGGVVIATAVGDDCDTVIRSAVAEAAARP